jgi:CheY-like chemotaxis protein
MVRPFTAVLLLVDDDPQVLRGMVRSLKGMPVSIWTATDVPTAWEAFHHETPDLILADHNLPGLTGYSFLQEVRHAHPSVKCVLHTGESRIQTGAPGLDSSSSTRDIPVLFKPVAAEQLRNLILDILGFEP